MRNSSMVKKTLAAALSLAMTVTAAIPGLGTAALASDVTPATEAPAPAPVTLGTVDFEAADDITLNSDVNNSALTEAAGANGTALTLGTIAVDEETGEEVEGAAGVEVPNYFAGQETMRQTLADGLRNANAVLAGNLKDAIVYGGGNCYGVGNAVVKDLTAYPVPKYTNGASVSLWAKMPESADAYYGDGDAVLLSFFRKTASSKAGTLTVTAKGDVNFIEGTANNNYKRNTVAYRNQGEGLLASPGEWVYVTLSVENNQIKLYMNGQAVDLAVDTYFNGTNGKMFNKGFSYVGNDDPFTVKDRRANYRDLFKNFTDAEVKAFIEADTTAGADVSKFEYLNSSQMLMVDWLTQADTKLYVGGSGENVKETSTWVQDAEGNWYAEAYNSGYNSKAAGMQVDDITFVNASSDDAAAAAAYEAVKDSHKTGYTAPVDELITFEGDASDRYIVNTNSADNNSAVTEEIINVENGTTGKVLTLGAPATSEEEDEEGNPVIVTANAAGVEIENGFLGHTELNETLSEALHNSGNLLNGNLLKVLKYYPGDETATWRFAYNWSNAKLVKQWLKTQYNKGASISTWVKMPADATENMPVIAFGRTTAASKQGSFALMANGDVAFQAGNSNNNWKRDAMIWSYNGEDTPLSKAGEWVYVTVAIKNNNVDVYYNGVKAEGSFNAQYKNTNSKMFNHGFNVIGNDDPAAVEDRYNNYNTAFARANFTDAEVDAIIANDTIAAEDIDKMIKSMGNTGMMTITEWLTDANTRCFVGGTDSTYKLTWWPKHGDAYPATANTYSAASAGVQVDDIEFYGTALDEAAAAAAYEAATKHATGDVPNAEASNGIDFETEAGVEALNADTNSAAVEDAVIGKTTAEDGTEADVVSKVLTLGAIAVDEEGNAVDAAGVKLTNGFAGHTELNQTLLKALRNNDAKLAHSNIAELLIYDFANGYWRLLGNKDTDPAKTTYPAPKYTNGLVMSAWAKMPQGATENTTLFAFERKTTSAKQGTFIVKANGDVYFQSGSANNDWKRNAMVWINGGADSVLAKAGEWVYVTVAIQNNNVDVYFNGVKTEKSLDKQYTGTNSKTFNKGFNAVGNDNINTNSDRRGAMANLFKNFTEEEMAEIQKNKTTAPTDISKFTFDHAGKEYLVDWLTSAETNLYAGGTSSAAKISFWPKSYDFAEVKNVYEASAAGLQLDDITFYGTNYNFDADALAAAAFEAATPHSTGYVAPTDEPTPTPVVTDEPTPTPVVTEEPTPTPVVTETPSPTPAVTETPSPTPAVTETPEPTPTPAVTETPAPVTYLYGDVDLDGEVTAEDGLAILKHVVKLQSLGEEGSLPVILADVDHVDGVTAADALAALKIVVQITEAEVYTPAAE